MAGAFSMAEAAPPPRLSGEAQDEGKRCGRGAGRLNEAGPGGRRFAFGKAQAGP